MIVIANFRFNIPIPEPKPSLFLMALQFASDSRAFFGEYCKGAIAGAPKGYDGTAKRTA